MKEGQPQKVFSYQGYRAPCQYVADANMWEGGIHRGRRHFILAISKGFRPTLRANCARSGRDTRRRSFSSSSAEC